MRITDVECQAVWCAERGVNFTLVLVDTDEGIAGVGEAGLNGFEAAVAAVVERFGSALVGEDPFRIEHLWQLLARANFFPAQGLQSAALSAVDIALWDIKGKALGVPVYELLGGRVRDRVVCYPHNYRTERRGAGDIEALVESCRETVAEGWRFVRWGSGYGAGPLEPAAAVRLAVREVEAVRTALGEAVEICLDVHTRLDVSDAVALCRGVEGVRPFFVEDPIRAENPDAFKTLRPRTAAPLAAGEQYASKWEFRHLIEGELIDYARIDPGIVGGLTEARKVAALAETHYVRIAPHCPLGPVLAAACAHLDFATPNFGVQELPVKPNSLLPEVFRSALRWEAGCLLPPTEPGLGIEVDRAAARRFPAQARPMVGDRLPDGSVINP